MIKKIKKQRTKNSTFKKVIYYEPYSSLKTMEFIFKSNRLRTKPFFIENIQKGMGINYYNAKSRIRRLVKRNLLNYYKLNGSRKKPLVVSLKSEKYWRENGSFLKGILFESAKKRYEGIKSKIIEKEKLVKEEKEIEPIKERTVRKFE